ncbi:T9SS type A sorting domain-containing protein [Flavivirga abyssicola]|uniref:T9SS type A sorting domain-containing protein n=1 Tax=Flavivirga abyssicola TaxID=3063533 RepID=UPI0026DFBEBA|nr:T9SS type A sorting domain-containing protein [Flavivirga sp. MEBiC07777]WVK14653.1 T9SS type A sorting domain-containing protein [Flavivirga sp. MEBiC07777]
MKYKTILLASIISFYYSMAQITYQDHIIEANLNIINSNYMLLADLDGDKNLDIVFANGQISWYKNLDGLGSYEISQTISDVNPSIIYINKFNVDDLDNDGDLDVIAISRDKDLIFWYENTNGKGNFGPRKMISDNNTDRPNYILSSDLDQDGDSDIISTSINDNKLAWYENIDGKGNFGHQKTISLTGIRPKEASIEDIDGDGDFDILLSSNSKLSWYKNIDGKGNFGEEILINSSYNSSINLSDIDNDGDFDIISTSSVDKTVTLYENINSLGNFNEQTISTKVYGASLSYPKDLDNDGDKDILVITSNVVFGDTYQLLWYENLDGKSSFSTQKVISNSVANTSSIQVEDINSDGFFDIVLNSNNNIAIYKSVNGTGNFKNEETLGGSINGATATYSSDIDGDGDYDVILTTDRGGDLVWYENLDGKGTFSYQRTIDASIENVRTVVTADIDNDGDEDVISGTSNNGLVSPGGKVFWYENLDGDGNFLRHRVMTTAEKLLSHLQIGDMNGDGFVDIIISKRSGGTIWFENLGGYFNPFDDKYEHSIGNSSNFCEPVDIDQDGDLDVLTYFKFSLTNSTGVSWYKNTDGMGNFAIGEAIDIANEASSLAGVSSTHASDVDGDGDLDILVGYGAYDKITWNENTDGMGKFSPQRDLFVNVNDISSPAIAVNANDIDKDGDEDIIYCSGNRNEVIWIENANGLGEFTHHHVISKNLDTPKDLHLADLNNDGKQDIISVSYNNKLLWHEIKNTLSLDKSSINSISIYPVPVFDILHLKPNGLITKVCLYNKLGQVVFLLEKNSGIEQINMSGLDMGFYVLKIQRSDGLIFTKKILKNN